MSKSHGSRKHTRRLFKSSKTKYNIYNKRIIKYNLGESIVVVIDSSYHKGLVHKRFQGKVGVVSELRGKGYVVKFKNGKEIVTLAGHIKKA